MTEITLPETDRLLLFGHGLFETVLVTESGPAFLDLHWQRLQQGARILGLELPSFETIESTLYESVRKQTLSLPYALRLTLSGGSPEHDQPSQLFISSRPIPYTPDQYSKGISLHLLPWRKNEYSPLAMAKTVNYSENYLGKREALRQGCDEGLWLNTQNNLCEGAASNLFLVKKGELFTPDLASGCLPGTRRELVFRFAAQLGLRIHQEHLPLESLLQADEVFMTNALMGIMPVQRLDDTEFQVSAPDDQKSVTRALALAYKKLYR
ncbi:aminotransferase class IV [Paradesulfitobacterium ferrireducens]|uniref:aminotransferase class IV n=1 Tax=Paradesulfitobacterium ferrireducens TaxID=2816476 RepID=UPI001A8D108E|nr:aminodeoxychorismate lyase [Paradesulfitobacterium ferrireducens]